MALEIPSIYIRTDNGKLYVFDHVTAQIIHDDKKEITLRITNPTEFDAQITLLAENKRQANLPLGDNAFLKWDNKITIKAGQSTTYTLRKD